MTKTPRTLASYPGHKLMLAEKYEQYYPPHRIFASPFGGMGGEIMAKQPSRIEIWNDVDDHVYSVFKVLQNDKEYRRLLDLLKNKTPNGRRQYEDCSRILAEHPCKHPRVRKAWAFLVCSAIGYRGPHPSLARSWSTNLSHGDRATKLLLDLPTVLDLWRQRFRRVRLEHTDWFGVFRRYDSPTTFWFVDPPYHPATLTSHAPLYRHVLMLAEHEKLLRTLLGAKGFILLCGYDQALYASYLFHWRRVSFDTRAIMGRGTPRKEQIWMNYEPDARKIASNKLLVARRYVEVMGSVDSAQRNLDRIKRLLSLPK